MSGCDNAAGGCKQTENSIIGIGVDAVDIGRFERALAKAPELAERLFVESERGLPVESLAARFAAKEAVAKALGAAGTEPGLVEQAQPWSSSWHDVIVHNKKSGAPALELTGQAAARAAASGINRWHISLTHDGGMALAFVIGEQI